MRLTRWDKTLVEETLDRIAEDCLRSKIEAGLRAMGHETQAVIRVEQALEWLLRQPTTEPEQRTVTPQRAED